MTQNNEKMTIRDELLELLIKIEGMTERVKQLKAQGESSKKAPIKSIRARRNREIKKLIKILKLDTSYYKETKQNNEEMPKYEFNWKSFHSKLDEAMAIFIQETHMLLSQTDMMRFAKFVNYKRKGDTKEGKNDK